MDVKLAKNIAQEFTNSFGEVVSGFKYGYSDLKEYSTKYYADLCFLTIENKIPDEPPLVGGAFGFTISKKSKKVNLLNFGEYIAFQEREVEIETLYQQLLAIKSGEREFSLLKAKYNLHSKDLLHLKRILSKEALKKEVIIEQLYMILKK